MIKGVEVEVEVEAEEVAEDVRVGQKNHEEPGPDVSQFSVRYEYLLWARPAKARC